jgi:UDP-glucose 4-epimerase
VVEHLPARPEVVHAFADHTRARTVFAPPAAVPLAVGLARMAAWLQTLEPAPPQRFAGIEIPDLLPAAWR